MRPCPVWILHLIFLSMKTASTVSSGRLISHQSFPNYLSGQISSWLCLHRLHQTQRMHKAQQSPPSMKQTKHVPQLPGPKGLHCSHPHFLPTCSYSQPNNAVLSPSCLAFEVLIPQEAGEGDISIILLSLKSSLKLRYFVKCNPFKQYLSYISTHWALLVAQMATSSFLLMTYQTQATFRASWPKWSTTTPR